MKRFAERKDICPVEDKKITFVDDEDGYLATVELGFYVGCALREILERKNNGGWNKIEKIEKEGEPTRWVIKDLAALKQMLENQYL